MRLPTSEELDNRFSKLSSGKCNRCGHDHLRDGCVYSDAAGRCFCRKEKENETPKDPTPVQT
jgi:hypothetical protein